MLRLLVTSCQSIGLQRASYGKKGRKVVTVTYTFLPPAMKLGQGYVFTGICHSVNRGGVPDQVPPGTRYTPPGTRYTPPGPGTPPNQVPPWTRYTPPRPGTPQDQVHPPDQEHPPPPRPGTPGTRYTPLDQGDTVYTRAVRILLECILVLICDDLNFLFHNVYIYFTS